MEVLLQLLILRYNFGTINSLNLRSFLVRYLLLQRNSNKLIIRILGMLCKTRFSAALLLFSQYFMTKPYACDPASLPKYPPNKEIDAKYREEARRYIICFFFFHVKNLYLIRFVSNLLIVEQRV